MWSCALCVSLYATGMVMLGAEKGMWQAGSVGWGPLGFVQR